MNALAPQYLGDAVYASFDGHHVVLTTDSHNQAEAGNTIFLEPQVLNSLFRYCEALKQELAKPKEEEK